MRRTTQSPFGQSRFSSYVSWAMSMFTKCQSRVTRASSIWRKSSASLATAANVRGSSQGAQSRLLLFARRKSLARCRVSGEVCSSRFSAIWPTMRCPCAPHANADCEIAIRMSNNPHLFMTILHNLLFGFAPILILGASIAAGTDDDPRHRRVFLLVYGLWAFTLAIANWIKSGNLFWIGLWIVFGIAALAISFFSGRR